jgi:hypothetical protein
VDASTIGSLLYEVGVAYQKHRDNPRAALQTQDADSTWADLRLTDADLAVLRNPSGDYGRFFNDTLHSRIADVILTPTTVGLTPILLCLIALGAVLARRHRRLRRLALRREFESLKSCAFLPDSLIDAGAGRA